MYWFSTYERRKCTKCFQKLDHLEPFSDPLIHSKTPYYTTNEVHSRAAFFALSKLRYVLGAQDIPDNLQKDFNNLIADYLWKDIYQVQLNVLRESYETGLKLQDIELKRKALRVNWIKHLILCKESDIEKHLSNVLIGSIKRLLDLRSWSSLLHQRKASAKPLIAKWEQEGVIDGSDWTVVWDDMFHR